LLGSFDHDTLHGEDGNDTLYGEPGNDRLYGENGNDHLDGGSGTDLLAGGAGKDTYDFNSAGDSSPTTRDTIYDFYGAGSLAWDKIDLSGIDANLYVAGNQAFSTYQLSYSNGTLTANIYGTTTDLQILLTGAPQLDIAGGDVVL
ncbi:MAG TPA: M10 family metallopeptidase C-terminal domain-containing protein, partial [Nitrosospira sp.]|nr:M10 family metallopeptidase C-terminal domain-containing protein [Nitrosospira sp.]